jgi:hypothetical protein
MSEPTARISPLTVEDARGRGAGGGSGVLLELLTVIGTWRLVTSIR